MDAISGLLHTILNFLVEFATLIINFFISVLQLFLNLIRSIAGQAPQ